MSKASREIIKHYKKKCARKKSIKFRQVRVNEIEMISLAFYYSRARQQTKKRQLKNRSRLTISCGFVFVCPGQDSNLHERNCSLPPQSSVSTNFTTWALLSRINFRECKYRHYFAIRKIFAEKTTKFAWGPPGSFCGGPGMLYLSVISLSR